MLRVVDMLTSATEVVCYCGAALSGLIAWRLSRMEKLNVVNRLLLVYFSGKSSKMWSLEPTK